MKSPNFIKKSTLIVIFSITSLVCIAQKNEKISTMDFVQVVQDNLEECRYYYQNNWKVLRKNAVKQGYIHSFQLHETTPTEEAPFQFILITTYADEHQFSKREANFQKLIKAKGALTLLNSKKPTDFRKTLYGKDTVIRD